MKLKTVKWWKVVLMSVLTLFFIQFVILTAMMFSHTYSDWFINERDDQETIIHLTSIAMLFVIVAFGFIVSLRSLILCFFPLKKPSVFARLSIRYGVYPALICLGIFLLQLAIGLILRNLIANTPETDEVPATLGYYKINGLNSVALILSQEALIVMLKSWLDNRLRPKVSKGRLESPLAAPQSGTLTGQSKS